MDVYGLIGNPVGHSLSPPMHEAAYAESGLDARYVTFEPEKGDGAAAVRAAETLGVRGLNVTIPFKSDVVEAVEPDPLAARIGAVNTVDFSTSPPTGYNTDAAGARRALEHHGVDIGESEAVLVGAGGAGRAVAYALADAGASLTVVNRTVETAEELADAVGAEADGLAALPERVADADLLVNATSVGMEEDRSPVPADCLHGGLTVMDAVYAPLDTRLLREARAAGAAVVDGAWMLLYQGVVAFERWTGEDAPVGAMNDALRERL
jgi:shikimate dehydrogenase